MLTIRWSTKFRRDVKVAQKRGKDFNKFKQIHEMLVAEKGLPPKNKDHILSGNWSGCRE